MRRLRISIGIKFAFVFSTLYFTKSILRLESKRIELLENTKNVFGSITRFVVLGEIFVFFSYYNTRRGGERFRACSDHPRTNATKKRTNDRI